MPKNKLNQNYLSQVTTTLKIHQKQGEFLGPGRKEGPSLLKRTNRHHAYLKQNIIDFATKYCEISIVKRHTQLQLNGLSLKPQLSFGGSQLRSHAKEQRAVPLDKALHLVMRSSHAKGAFSFKTKRLEEKVFEIVQKQSERFNVKLYGYANSGNHLHMVIKVKSRKGYVGFIRTISGLIARTTLFAQRNNAKHIQFWDARPFTRIVSWGKDFAATCTYVLQNTLEAHGFITYQPRVHKKPVLLRHRPASG